MSGASSESVVGDEHGLGMAGLEDGEEVLEESGEVEEWRDDTLTQHSPPLPPSAQLSVIKKSMLAMSQENDDHVCLTGIVAVVFFPHPTRRIIFIFLQYIDVRGHGACY